MAVSVKILSMSRNQLEERLAQVKAMLGATASYAGEAGLVPAPAIGERQNFLRGDGTWAAVPVPGEATQEAAGLMSAADKAKLDGSYTAQQVDEKVASVAGSVYRPKGTKQTFAELPAEGNAAGDVWNVAEAYTDPESGKLYPANTNWAYTEEGTWDPLGGEFDFTPYVRTVSLPSAAEGASVDLSPADGKVSLPAASASGYGLMAPAQVESLEQAAEDIESLSERMTTLENSTPTDSTFQELTARVAALETLLQGIPDGTVLLATTETD